MGIFDKLEIPESEQITFFCEECNNTICDEHGELDFPNHVEKSKNMHIWACNSCAGKYQKTNETFERVHAF